MSAAARRTAVGVVLLILAVLAWAGRAFLVQGGPHSWDPGAEPPATVHLTAGQTYHLSTRGGPADLIARQLTDQPELVCSLTARGGQAQALQVTADVSDTRVTHRVASFTAPVTGDVSISCTNTGAVFIDDADDAAFDWGTGLVWLSAAIALLAVAFLLSGLYGVTGRRRPSSGPPPGPGSAPEPEPVVLDRTP